MRIYAAVLIMLLAVGFVSTPILAGAQQPDSSGSQLRSLLDRVAYNPQAEGPLLFVGGPRGGFRNSPNFASIRELAAAIGMQVIPVGGLKVLAPSKMVVIEDNPGKADPFAGLPAEERFKYLLSLFSDDQWKRAGSAGGIGATDMDDRQRALFAGLIPEHLTVQRTVLEATAEANVRHYVSQGEPKTYDPADARLRLVRKVQFQFSKQGADDYGYSSGVEPGLGEPHDILTMGGGARGDAANDPGVVILRTVDNRLKRGQIDFGAPRLQMMVGLDQEIKKVGDLIGRIAKATGLDVTADQRVTALPLQMRAVPGQQARASELLKALCWSVSGTFRLVGTSTYLLTDDLAGIGTRFARLAEWGEAAESARHKAMEGLADAVAKHDPLSHVEFAPGDQDALPPALKQRVDESYRKERFGAAPEMMPSDLPNGLQLKFQEQIAYWTGTGVTLRTDRVRVGTEMVAQFVFPGGAAVPATFSQNVGSQYLQSVAFAPKETTAATKLPRPSPLPKPMPETLKRRVLAAQLPKEDADTASLLAAAKAKGFSEVWLETPLADPAALDRTRAAIAAGVKMDLRVGATVSLLHGGGLDGAEDVNIFGETGAEFAKRRAILDPASRGYVSHVAGWTVLSSAEAVRRLLPCASIPGLSALVLRATAAPGWAGDVQGGDGIPTNGYLGYSIENRLASIRAFGMDPIDIVRSSYAIRTDQGLPFFPCPLTDGPVRLLNEFRLNQNRGELVKIHTALVTAQPKLALYLDDRASGYADPNTRWFGRWDRAEQLPVNPVYAVESDARDAAMTASREPLLACKGWGGNPVALARTFGDTAQQAAAKWRGVVLDLSSLTPLQARQALSALPPAPLAP